MGALFLSFIAPLSSNSNAVPEHLQADMDDMNDTAWVEIRDLAEPDIPDAETPSESRQNDDGGAEPDTGSPSSDSPGGGDGSQNPGPWIENQPAVQEENLCVDGEVVDGECVDLSRRICGVPGPISMPTAEDPSGGLRFAPTFCPPEEDDEPEPEDEPEEEDAPEEEAAESDEPEDSEEEEPPPPPTITTADFLELPFEPAGVSFEPELIGFGYLNRHVNVFADVETQVISQDMLGYEVDIRALPSQFHWDYGDGTTRTTSEPGGPLPEFDSAGFEVNKTDTETITSHAYAETGRFPVTVETVFLGEYRIDGGPWMAIPGSATLASEPGEADIWRISARHVSGPCEDAGAWGCNGPIELEEGDTPPAIFEDQYDGHGNWIGPQG